MELVKRLVHMTKCNCKSTTRVTVDDDFNVPDVQADILRVIKEKGTIETKDVSVSAGKGIVKGNLTFQVLYIGDDKGHPLCTMSGTIPFETSMNLEEGCRDDELSLTMFLEDLQTEVINSRKIGVKAVIQVEMKSEALFDGEGAVELVDGDGIQVQKEKMEITSVALNQKDTFRYRDEWDLPASKDSIEHILYENVWLTDMNTRLDDEKILLTGQINVFFLYQTTTEQLDYGVKTLSLSGSVPCNGCDDSMVEYVKIGIHSKDLAVKEDENGELRVLDLEMVLDLNIQVYKQEDMEVLSDFYSTRESIAPVRGESYFENLLMKNTSLAKVNGKITVNGEMPMQIWNVDGTLFIEDTELVEGGIMVRGTVAVDVLYVPQDSDLPLCVAGGVIPLEQKVELDGLTEDSVYTLDGVLDGMDGMMNSENEIEVKGTIRIGVIAFEPVTRPLITGVEELEASSQLDMPGMIGYVVKENESLWDIAKHFYTTMENIMELNEREKEEVKQGEILLLMKENAQI